MTDRAGDESLERVHNPGGQKVLPQLFYEGNRLDSA